MIVVGLTGPAGCGKDTVGEILVEDHGFVTHSFAKPIKQMVCALLDEPLSKWADRQWREHKMPRFCDATPRELAQTLGTEWGRDCIHPDIWLNLGINRGYDLAFDAEKSLCITDVRFENEAQRIRNVHRGTIIHVERRHSDTKSPHHISEQGVEHAAYDYLIKNDGGLTDLRHSVADVVRMIHAEI